MTKIKIALILSLVAIPSLVLGAGVPPSNVQGVHASTANGILTITWQPATDDTAIAFYRVYFSRTSILENNGNYDDFERTRGTETAFSFTKVPVLGDKIFVSVLAVDNEGNESEGFETEASAIIPGMEEMKEGEMMFENVPPDTNQVSSSVATQTPDALPMMYTAVFATSSTGLLLSFSKEIDPLISLEPANFLVQDGSGNTLKVTKVDRGGPNLLITMESQSSLKLYTLKVLTTIRAKDGSELTGSAPSLQFLGFESSQITTTPTVTSSIASSAPTQVYIKNPILTPPVVSPLSVRLVPMEQKNGQFTVLAQWRGGTNSGVGYSVSVSRDGVNFDPAIQTSAQETSMQFTNIRPESKFIVRVEERGPRGEIQSGNASGIELPASGVGLLGIASAAGALAARKRMKRRKKTC